MGLNTPMPDFVSGTVVDEPDLDALADALDAIQASWDTWAPTLTNFTVGNGTLVTRFMRIGKTIRARILFVAGSTSTFGGGTFLISPPVPPRADYVDEEVMGVALLHDASVGSGSRTGATVVLAGGALFLVADRVSPGSVAAAIPWTWAVGDKFSAEVMYEAA